MKTLKEYPEFRDYPYRDALVVDVHNNRKLHYVCTEDRTLDMQASTMVQRNKYRITDKKEFVKIYRDSLKTILNLSTTAQRILWYILDILQAKATCVDLIPATCAEVCGFKASRSVHIGLAELIEKDILRRTTWRMRYWVNPVVMFNGDRIEFINEYIYDGQ